MIDLTKSSMGWFYGFKLHVSCDFMGNIIKCSVTQGAANELKIGANMMKNLKAKYMAIKAMLVKKSFSAY